MYLLLHLNNSGGLINSSLYSFKNLYIEESFFEISLSLIKVIYI